MFRAKGFRVQDLGRCFQVAVGFLIGPTAHGLGRSESRSQPYLRGGNDQPASRPYLLTR